MAKDRKKRKPSPKKKPQNVPETKEVLGHGLVLYGNQHARWRLQADDFAQLRALLGDELLVQFARTFTLSNHMTSLFDLMGMNIKGAPEDSPRQRRNLLTLAFSVCGLARELSEVLTALKRAGVRDLLSDEGKQRWDALVKFDELTGKKTVKIVRDEMTFHAGKPDTMRRGIQALEDGKRSVMIFDGDGTDIRNVHVLLGGEIAYAGAGLNDVLLREALTDVRDAHFSTIAFIKEIFTDVLRTKGVVAQPLRPLTADQLQKMQPARAAAEAARAAEAERSASAASEPPTTT